MYRATRPLLVRSGMRRILKRKPPVHEYIRQAVESGTYRTTEELAAMKEPEDEEDDNITARRRRFNIVRGTSILDYPTEYVILQQHPPLPDPPRTPKLRAHQRVPRKNERLETLTQKYYDRMEKHPQRQQQRHPQEQDLDAAPSSNTNTDWYYKKLLGISKSSQGDEGSGSAALFLSNKSAALRHAYHAAVEHYRLERTDAEIAAKSEKEIMAEVDDILAMAATQEQVMAQAVAQQAQTWRNEASATSPDVLNVVQQQQMQKEAPTAATPATPVAPPTAATTKEGGDQDESAASAAEMIENLQSTPRTWEALQRWSDRLQAVPYGQWTIGASTALDHWIALTVLQISEHTWQAVLQGKEPETDDIGPAIIATREALFPETILDARKMPVGTKEPLDVGSLEGEDLEDETVDFGDEEGAGALTADDPSVRSLDELLAELGSLSDANVGDEPEQQEEEPEEEEESPLAHLSKEERMIAMTEELQEWRRQKQAGTFDETVFYGWTRRYMETMGIDKNSISYEDFSEAILFPPPLDRSTSDAFWNRLTTRADTAELAVEMFTNTEMADVAKRFDVKPGDVVGLWNVAALRPLLDEYASEVDREMFFAKYGDILVEGMPLEHLVVMPDDRTNYEGTVPANSLPAAWASVLPPTARVRLQTMAYRSNVDDDLYTLWKEHKAGRARYEEKLFRTKRLGLLYGDDKTGMGDDEEDV